MDRRWLFGHHLTQLNKELSLRLDQFGAETKKKENGIRSESQLAHKMALKVKGLSRVERLKLLAGLDY
jgi:hypothetical protein